MRTPHNERLTSDIADAQVAGQGPERKCILSGRSDARDALIRLAISPPDATGKCHVLPDVMARAPGRGAWIGVTRPELDIALAKGKLRGALARAFHGTPLLIPDNLSDLIEAALVRVITERLGLELRAGRLLMGSDRISDQARMGKVTFLGHASDASNDGSRKLDQAWRVGQDAEGSGQRGTILPLDRAALSVALGRDNVVHMALTNQAAAERLNVPLGRLLHFMGRLNTEPVAHEDGADEDDPGRDGLPEWTE
jgi:predicted RNA-binding protein YlxR (DUF448 family)